MLASPIVTSRVAVRAMFLIGLTERSISSNRGWEEPGVRLEPVQADRGVVTRTSRRS